MSVQKYVIDSIYGFVEDESGPVPTVRQLDYDQWGCVYRIINPWADEEEERLASEKEPKDLKWGLFP